MHSKKLIFKEDDTKQSSVRIVYANGNHSEIKNNPNIKYIWFQGILDAKDYLNATNSTDYLISHLNAKLKFVQQAPFQDEINNGNNYTCLSYDMVNATQYLLEIFTLINPKSKVAINHSSSCKHCKSAVTSTLLILFVISIVLTLFGVKFLRNKSRGIKRSDNSITVQHKFHEALKREFEKSTVKQYQTDGNELKIYIA